ncbi:hypothetical protein GCM10018966_096310 [Streptomyces yanii]
MLLRLAYLAVTNTFTLLRLLPMSEREKNIEILALRHQLLILQRQVGKPAFTDTDRAVLVGLLHHLPMDKYGTSCCWYAWTHSCAGTAICSNGATPRPAYRGDAGARPRSDRSAPWSCAWQARTAPGEHRRIHGEVAAPGIKVAASTVWEILREHGIPPAPERASTTWSDFLRSQADAPLACDFLETRTLTGARLYLFAAIEHATRRIRVLGATAHPTADWTVQLGRNLDMDLEDADSRAKFLIRDRDSKFTQAFDAVLADAGLEVVTSGVRVPRMNSITERWIQSCRRELLDRTLKWDQSHLLHTLREFELHYNKHRPHRALDQAAPLPARTDHRARETSAPGGSSTRSTQRDPARVSTCRVTRADD